MIPWRSNWVRERETVSMVRPRWSAISVRDMGKVYMVVLRHAVGHVEQEGRDLLHGVLAAEKQHMILCPSEGAHHGGDDLMGEGGGTGSQYVEAAAAIHDDDGRAERFGAKAVLLAGLDAKDVTREVEGVDLPASVAQEFRGADRAGHDLVEVGGAVAFGKDLLVLSHHAGGSEGRGLGVRPGRRDAAQKGGVRCNREAGGSERGLHGTLVVLDR